MKVVNFIECCIVFEWFYVDVINGYIYVVVIVY